MPNYTNSTDIANAALNMLGQGPIASLTAPTNTADKVLTSLQFWYAKSVEAVFRDIKVELEKQFFFAVLLLKDPTPEWRACYYLDPSCINFDRIMSGAYPDSRASEVAHRKLLSQGGPAANLSAVSAGSATNPSIFTIPGMQNGQVVSVAGLTDSGNGNFTPGDKYMVGMATTTTCQLFSLNDTPDPTQYATYNTNGIPIYLVTPGLAAATLTPQDHYRVYCNMLPHADWRTQQSLPQFEVGVVPDILMWPDDFCKLVACQLAIDAGVGIVGIDHKEQVDSLRDQDYPHYKAKAAGAMGRESFKGRRQLSESTLARMPRRRYHIPGTAGLSSGFASSTNP